MRWLAVLPLLLACSVTPGEFHDRVQAARGCSDDASCLFTEARACLCPAAVNASSAERLNDLLWKVDCGGVTSSCADPGKARCIEGRCTAVREPVKPPAEDLRFAPARMLPGRPIPGGPGRLGAPLQLR